ncbi:MAG: insulinase family protein [Polyangiaceae bacterium]|nr:insulinase family protein [Polyangiaceae bacterium]
MSARRLLAWAAAAALSASACDFGVRLSGAPPTPVASTRPVTTAVASVSAPTDPLGPKPVLAAPKPFEPPTPVVFQGPGGVTVWLVERMELPVVYATVVVPYGSASDPVDAPGTMALLSDMLDEGAGARDALQLSETVASLGATLGVGTGADSSQASVLSLRTKFDTAFELLADVVARPKLAKADFNRTHKLWKNALKKRTDDPMSVASTVAASILYGGTAGYGHPSLGIASKADAVTHARLKEAYDGTWRPERATMIVVGQISKKELEAMMEKHLASWKPKGEPKAAPKLTPVVDKRPRFVLVDRPKAVQTVIYASRAGTPASDERAPNLGLISDALGGSFTSRLNMNLREEKGWTYGVGSGFASTRGEGLFVVRTSVEAQHTGASLKEIVGELASIADKGLLEEELAKVKAQDRASLVETYEGSTGVGSRLGQLAGLGLPVAFDAGASRLRQAASREDLARLAKERFDPGSFTIVLVGDRDLVQKQLADAGFEAPAIYTLEGEPAK